VGGRYELGELLGRGGMAEVRRGTDIRLGRTVAVKRLRTDLAADPTFQARFRREAQSAAGLNHPSIVSVYDTGEEMAPDGSHVQPYIVMEYVAGRTLREVLNDGRKVLPERALEIMVEVLGALDYSHRAGIIHRDIKPANVMLTPSGDVKVMDFGIARAISDGTSTMTQTQAVVGTAQYLSPEQARGESVDSRSDVYSAGCLLYELLTGRPPFVGDSPFSVAYQHVRENPEPPSAYNPELTPELDAILMKSLAKRVEDRYQSAAEMQADIQRYLDGRPIDAPTRVAPAPLAAPAGEPTSIFTAPQPAQDYDEERPRKRWPLVLLVVVVAALVAGGVVWGMQLFAEDEPVPVAVPRVTNMTLEAAEARLDAEGLALGEVTRENSDDVPADRIISQDPGAQDTVDPGTEVDVVVSAGQETVVVPFLLDGTTVDEARAALEDRGLRSAVQEQDSDRPEGEVLATDPEASTTVPVGSTVTLTVSTGPVEVPNVVGLTENEARQRLQDAELQVRVEYDDTTPAERGTVLDQDPEGLEGVARGSTVTITVSRYEEPSPTPPPSPSTEPSPSGSPEQPEDGDETPGAEDGGMVDVPPTDAAEPGAPVELPEDGTASG
jgi:beta-lactam-binding protein with PASTA domain/predicted Ser/Thr protein kinase